MFSKFVFLFFFVFHNVQTRSVQQLYSTTTVLNIVLRAISLSIERILSPPAPISLKIFENEQFETSYIVFERTNFKIDVQNYVLIITFKKPNLPILYFSNLIILYHFLAMCRGSKNLPQSWNRPHVGLAPFSLLWICKI